MSNFDNEVNFVEWFLSIFEMFVIVSVDGIIDFGDDKSKVNIGYSLILDYEFVIFGVNKNEFVIKNWYIDQGKDGGNFLFIEYGYSIVDGIEIWIRIL